ncbi:MAG: hypothetical protein V4598_16570 [Bdellovibrionota bacterium]
MKIHLRGKYSKKDGKWKVDIAPLGLSFEADTAMRAFHKLHKYLKKEIHEDLGCDIRIQDHGDFIIVTHTNHQDMVSWLTTKILLLDDGAGEILGQLLFDQELEDDD